MASESRKDTAGAPGKQPHGTAFPDPEASLAPGKSESGPLPSGPGKSLPVGEAGQNASGAQDQELIDMLEQLNQTLDSAQAVLQANQAAVLPGKERGKSETGPGSNDAGERPRRTTSPAVAAALGVVLGIAALSILWPVWQSMTPSGAPQEAAKDAARLNETVVAREGRSDLAAPKPDTVLSRPAGIAPAPSTGRPQQGQNGRKEAAAASAASAPGGESAPSEDMPPVAAAISPGSAGPGPGGGAGAGEDEGGVSTAALPGKSPAGEAPSQRALSQSEEAGLMRRGLGLVDARDIASARLVFEHAARLGSVEAMYALARTYDPGFLAQRGVIGIQPDIAAALEWYGRAAQGGHDLADARAAELEKQERK